jgi:glycine cleavage system H protein
MRFTKGSRVGRGRRRRRHRRQHRAAEQLGDVVFVETPTSARPSRPATASRWSRRQGRVGRHAPVSGEVVEANGALGDAPRPSTPPRKRGWFAKVKLATPTAEDALRTATPRASGDGTRARKPENPTVHPGENLAEREAPLGFRFSRKTSGLTDALPPLTPTTAPRCWGDRGARHRRAVRRREAARAGPSSTCPGARASEVERVAATNRPPATDRSSAGPALTATAPASVGHIIQRSEF